MDSPDRTDLLALVLGLRALLAAGHRYRLAAAEHFGLAVVETHAISYLDAYGPMTQGRLGRLMGLTSGGVTGVVDRLERADTARRAPDPRDRRSNVIELTDRAVAILATSSEQLTGVFEQLDPAVLDALMGAFPELAAGVNRVADALEA